MNQEKLQQIQLLEQSMTNLLMQKQQFQGKLAEIESAQAEITGKPHAYKIIGNLMIQHDAAKLQQELDENRRLMEIRIRSVEKQEEAMRLRAKKLQDEVMKGMEKKGKAT